LNLLADEIADAILDAAAQAMYTVRRGRSCDVSVTTGARRLDESEEGKLRPQIQDRFGLRVLVRGLTEAEARLEVYRRVMAYQSNPRAMRAGWAAETLVAADEIAEARGRLPQVKLAPEAEQTGMAWINRLGIDSHRAEVVLFESARAHAAVDGRAEADLADLRAVAAMALRQRAAVSWKITLSLNRTRRAQSPRQ